LEGRRKLDLEPGGGLHTYWPAELGDDRELGSAHRENAQRNEPDQDCTEAEDSQELDAACNTDGGQHSTSEDESDDERLIVAGVQA